MQLRLRATLIHLAASTVVAVLAWWLVFRLWYPAPFAELSGGAALFLMLVSVDVVIGPALTAVVANPAKTRGALMRDLGVILALQVAAFGYGLLTMAAARPVALVFEVDLMRVVSANDVDHDTLQQAPEGLRELSWTGPVLLAAVKPSDPAEQFRSIELGLAGVPLAALPVYWRPYATLAPQAWAKASPVTSLVRQRPEQTQVVATIAAQAGVAVADLRMLPVLARKTEWLALLAQPGARVVGYLPIASGN
jgi:hypothetical protein